MDCLSAPHPTKKIVGGGLIGLVFVPETAAPDITVFLSL